jgi:anaerobic magnesium-protoporphyrin IX monomethyl ester cyclase
VLRVLVMAGEGPYFKNSEYLDGTFFDQETAPVLARKYASAGQPPVTLDALHCRGPVGVQPLMRSKKGVVPHLTSFTLDSIMRLTDTEYELFRLERLWEGGEPRMQRADVTLLSTTFICDRHTLRRVITWISEHFPGAMLVLGGQYSNLKYAEILRRHSEVDFVVRGDGEVALPALLQALDGRGSLDGVPNLMGRRPNGRGMRSTPLQYVDLEEWPSPGPEGAAAIIPYESMRGCPFSCKFCSFPSASPKWRYKSASKIATDWAAYAERNGARHIRAMDSTFTVPFRRLRELLPLLSDRTVTWEAYARANNLKSAQLVDALAGAGCTKLSIGFESMSDNTLGYMKKLVSSAENRMAFELLRNSDVGYRISVMVGYPGETPEDFELTRRFLVDEYEGHFMLNIFSFTDETMPVWQDAERFRLTIRDEDNPDYSWSHAGMDVETARDLLNDTLDETRLRSDASTVLLWQTDYETPLAPHLSRVANMRLEKLVDRLGMAPRDHSSPAAARPAITSLLAEMASYGVELGASAESAPDRLERSGA